MFSEGFEFETEKGRFVIRDGVPVKAEPKRGPLGGELKELKDCDPDEDIVLRCKVNDLNWLNGKVLVETNVPPRSALSGERMTAGEAAQVPGIVGRWVAVQVDELCDNKFERPLPLNAGGFWFDAEDELILLPEGFGE